MKTIKNTIVPYSDDVHRDQVVTLWKSVFGYDAPHNEPNFVIEKKLAMSDGLFFVAEVGGKVVGTIMAGYDGHRGWIYSLAVQPECRMRGIGSQLVRQAEKELYRLGCPKINLQILQGNESVEAFYRKLGYQTEPRISMGKQIPKNMVTSHSDNVLFLTPRPQDPEG